MNVRILVLPSPGDNAIEMQLYEELLTQYCTLLTEQGLQAAVIDNPSGRFEIEPRRIIQIATSQKRTLYPVLKRLPGARELYAGGRDAIRMYVFGHDPQSEGGDNLFWISDQLDHVDIARVLDDKRLLLYFTNGSSAVITVESIQRQD